MWAVAMVTETRTFCLRLGKKTVVNSRFSRLLFSFWDAFVYIYRKGDYHEIQTAEWFYNIFLVFLNFFLPFIDKLFQLKFLKSFITFHKLKLFFLENTFCALSNEI